jgi:hypothetical protein
MTLSVLVALQGLHMLEHSAQWVQFHILRWPAYRSIGLMPAANAEWVHFVWSWVVLLMCVLLFARGMRGPWGWLLLIWTAAHSAEHAYLLVRYLQIAEELRALGTSSALLHTLPGILGRDGWLATAEATQGTWLCRLPGLTTATRLDVHFWWNVGTTLLLLPAANAFLIRLQRSRIDPRINAN